MTLAVDVFWSFRSPYSYLATPRLAALAQDYDVAFRMRPVYPLALRVEGWFQTVNPLWRPYLVRDVMREAERLGIPFHWPKPDPVSQDFSTGTVAAEQPLIRRLTRLGVAAEEAGRGLAFIVETAALIWQGTRDWHEGEHMAAAARRAGLDLAALERAVAADVARHEALIAENEAAHAAAGHWGVPTFAFRGEPFFGQDRLDALLWRLGQAGLARRA